MTNPQPRLIYKPAFTVVGFSCPGVGLDGGSDALWTRLSERFQEIPGVDPDAGYGVHSGVDGAQSYLAGLAVPGAASAGALGAIPPGMTAQALPENAYAVFPHAGRTETLSDTVEWVRRAWFPQSGYQWAEWTYFEYYDDRFVPDSAQSLLFLYFPIKT